MKTKNFLKGVIPVVGVALLLVGCSVAPGGSTVPSSTSEPFITVEGSAGVVDATPATGEPFIVVEGSAGIVDSEPQEDVVAPEEPVVSPSPVPQSQGGSVPVNPVVVTPNASTVVSSPAPVVAPVGEVKTPQAETPEPKTTVVIPSVGVGTAESTVIFNECFVDDVAVAYVPASVGCGDSFKAVVVPVAPGGFGVGSATSVKVWVEKYVDGVLVEKTPSK